jgi:hypothetical protein
MAVFKLNGPRSTRCRETDGRRASAVSASKALQQPVHRSGIATATPLA